MLMTIVEAHVAEAQWPVLQDAYATGIKELPPGIVQTFLAHDLNDASHWQIVSIWESYEALMAARASHPTMAANAMFQAARAEPTHTVHEVAAQAAGGRT